MAPASTRKTLDYADQPVRRRPGMTRFLVAAVSLLVLGMMLADAGNRGKGEYDWRAAVGVGCVFGGIVVYFVGRWMCRQPRGRVS